MEEKTIIVNYNDLSENLKEELREHARNDPYLIPDDWYSDIIEFFKEKYADQIYIDERNFEFDLDRNHFHFEGSVYVDDDSMTKVIPEQFYVYLYDIEWLGRVDNDFLNGEMNREFEVEEDEIELTIENEIFSKEVDIDFEEGDSKGSINISIFKPLFQAVKEKYESPNAIDILNEWLVAMDTAENIFFQDDIQIDADDYDEVVEELTKESVNKVEAFMENEYYEILDDFVSKIYDEFTTDIRNSYEYYFEDENIDGMLDPREYEVIVDDDGEQLEIVDLDGK